MGNSASKQTQGTGVGGSSASNAIGPSSIGIGLSSQSSSAISVLDPRTYFQTDLPKFILSSNSRIGNGKFMKTYVAKVDGISIVVKVFMRYIDDNSSENRTCEVDIISSVERHLSHIWKTLSPARYPNLLPYELWIKSTNKLPKTNFAPVYLMRQYMYSNLHDRLLTRPFLTHVEKLWLVYQLLKSIEICHSHGIVHGDVKTENCLCTTWNWLVLTDFAPFKPALLPDDNPTDFQFYFDSMGRSSCYIAPERFFHRHANTSSSNSSGDSTLANDTASLALDKDSLEPSTSGTSVPATAPAAPRPLTSAIDVFSLGCTIAEVFLDGATFIDLPQMLQYLQETKKSAQFSSSASSTPALSSKRHVETLDDEDSPAAVRNMLRMLPNKLIRDVVRDMTQQDPEKRTSVRNYRHILEGRRDPSTLIARSTIAESSNTNMDENSKDVFPDYFSRVVHPIFQMLHVKGVSPDDRIVILCENYDEIVAGVTAGGEDAVGVTVFQRVALSIPHSWQKPTSSVVTDSRGISTSKRVSASTNSGVESTRSTGNYSDNSDISDFVTKESLKSALLRPDNSFASVLIPNDLEDASDDQNQNQDQTDNKKKTIEHDANHLNQLPIDELMQHCFSLIADLDRSDDDQWKKKSSASASADTQSGKHVQSQHVVQQALNNARVKTHDFLPVDSQSELQTSSANCSSYIPFCLYNSTTTAKQRLTFEGVLLFVQVLCSCYRHVQYPQTRLVSLSLLVRLGGLCADEVILHRIVPTLLLAIDDAVSAQVRAVAVRGLTSLLALVTQVDKIESNIFPQYIFPVLAKIPSRETEVLVKVAFADCLASLADTAKLFLDQTYLYITAVDSALYQTKLKALHSLINRCVTELVHDSSSNNSHNSHSNRHTSNLVGDILQQSTFVSQCTHGMLTRRPQERVDSRCSLSFTEITKYCSVCGSGSGADTKQDDIYNKIVQPCEQKVSSVPHPGDTHSCSLIKRALLNNILRLCHFFGDKLDNLLSHILTFLNDNDCELRIDFCLQMSAVCVFVGPVIAVERILPCIENALCDAEERVVVVALKCLTALIEARVIEGSLMRRFSSNCVVALMLHPCASIRQGAIRFIAVCIKALGYVDSLVFIAPLLRPLLQYDIMSEDSVNNILTSFVIEDKNHNSDSSSSSSGSHSQSTRSAEILQEALLPPVSRKAFNMMLRKLLILNLKTDQYNHRLSAKQVVDEPDTAIDSTIQLVTLTNYIDRLAKKICNQHSDEQLCVFFQATAANNLVGSLVSSEKSGYVKCNLKPISKDIAITVVDANVQLESLYVPNQRYGLQIVTPQSSSSSASMSAVKLSQQEQIRSAIISNPYVVSNPTKLKSYYGLHVNLNEALQSVFSSVAMDDPSSVHLFDTHTQRYVVTSASGRKIVASSMVTKSYVPAAAAATTNEMSSLVRRIQALKIPPLPPDVGALKQPSDGRKYNGYIEPLDLRCFGDPESRVNWRPRENMLVMHLHEHSLRVSQLAVAQDHSFFASASCDKSVKIWKTTDIEKAAVPKSALTYRKHGSGVTALCVLENSHTVVSGSDDSSIHVWRVDSTNEMTDDGSGFSEKHRSSEIKLIQTANEGAVVALSHYNGDVASLITYVTQRGGLHGWDLRCASQAFHLPLRPELGQPLCMAVAPDRTWLAVGTQKGFVSIFDIRYNITNKLFQHSSQKPIYRMAACKSRPPHSYDEAAAGDELSSTKSAVGATSGACLFVAAGHNETALFAVPEGGECLKCFRSVSLSSLSTSSRQPLAPLPFLSDVPLPRYPNSPVTSALDCYYSPMSPRGGSQQSLSALQSLSRPVSSSSSELKGTSVTGGVTEHTTRAMLGRVSDKGTSYLITAGTDKLIRYWDLSSPLKCYLLSGLQPCQPKSTFEMPMNEAFKNKLFISYDCNETSHDVITQSHLPIKETRGPVKTPTTLRDAVTDLKCIDIPLRLMISSSNDGQIKIWR